MYIKTLFLVTPIWPFHSLPVPVLFSFIQVTLLLVHFTEEEQNQPSASKTEILNKIADYNRRFSGEPRPVSHRIIVWFTSHMIILWFNSHKIILWFTSHMIIPWFTSHMITLWFTSHMITPWFTSHMTIL